MCGYRRPKNLKDCLVRANLPYKIGDEKFRDENNTEKVVDIKLPTQATKSVVTPVLKQKSMLDYVLPIVKSIDMGGNLPVAGTSKVPTTETRKQLTPKGERFQFLQYHRVQILPPT